jgi:flagellar basal-body rod protein FlgB
MSKELTNVEALEAGLKATNLRQSVIANNIANMDTPGFRRQDVQFKEVLAKAMETGQADPAELDPKIVTPQTTEVNDQGNDVDMDLEVGEMLKTNGQYKMFVRMLVKEYQRMSEAIQTE